MSQRIHNKYAKPGYVVYLLGLLAFTSHSLVLAASLSPVVGPPEQGSEGVILLLKKCSACHGAPKPDVHTANIWPGIVYRMQIHMTTKGQVPLTKGEQKLIVEYLQRHAAKLN